MTSDKVNNPFLLKPEGKDYLWGGNRLNDYFSKNINMSPLAETWECSTHPDGLSVVCSGVFDGLSLAEVLRMHPEFLGSGQDYNGQLPILIKFIDASEELSVQVHPDDEYADKNENGQLGKTEMWYVLDAAKEATLTYGFNRDLTKDEVRQAIDEGRLEKYLQRVAIHKNDVFLIEAGMVHAIGKGTLVAEIQENSNLTYRLYDYDRVDKKGKRRPLHIDKALEVSDLRAAGEPKQPMRVLKYSPGMARELICSCQYFEVYRMLINTERCRQRSVFKADGMSFRVLLCVEGCGTLQSSDGSSFCFFRGDCIFIPATSGEILLHGRAQFLDIRC